MLVAHSYGGGVISNVPADAGKIIGLVYVNAFALDPGKSCFSLAGLIIPPELQRFMAERAATRHTLEIPGASHAATISEPQATTDLILEAVAVPAAR